MRKSGISVASNIVEGCARLTLKEYCRFIEISYGSLKELHYQFSIAERLEYLNSDQAYNGNLTLTETEKVLGSLLHSLWKSK